jgi:NDP-sugar pyrophosphorylase family protein
MQDGGIAHHDEMDPRVDVAIPLGPYPADEDALWPMGRLLPKVLMPIGPYPMLWYALEQLVPISNRITRVFCITARARQSAAISKWLQRFAGRPHYPFEVVTRASAPKEMLVQSLCRLVDRAEIKEHVLIVYPDVFVLAPPGASVDDSRRAFFTRLLDEHLDACREAEVYGTLAANESYPLEVGMLTASQVDPRYVGHFRERPDRLPVALLGRGTKPVLFNMAIGVFRRSFFSSISRRPNLVQKRLYDVVEQLVGGNPTGRRFRLFRTSSQWVHLHGLDDIGRQQRSGRAPLSA